MRQSHADTEVLPAATVIPRDICMSTHELNSGMGRYIGIDRNGDDTLLTIDSPSASFNDGYKDFYSCARNLGNVANGSASLVATNLAIHYGE